MNQPPLIFLGMFAALALSWYGMVVQPQFQLGRATPGTNVLNTADLYPQPRPGLAQHGLQVYRALGCATCHSQQVRQDGVLFDLVLKETGTNTADVVPVVARVLDVPAPEAGHRISTLPVRVLTAEPNKAKVDAAAEALDKAGAKTEVRLLALGPDIERGWGRGRTVAADFLYDRPALPGSMRLGPDLANVGARRPDAAWHYRHLYAPRTLVAGSLMPPYRFLFERLPAAATPPADAFSLNPGLAGDWIVPTDDARALIAYLRSLRAEVSLLERPVAADAGAATNAPAATNLVPAAAGAATP